MKIRTKQLGTIWAACIPELGISALGATEKGVHHAVKDALDTHQPKPQ